MVAAQARLSPVEQTARVAAVQQGRAGCSAVQVSAEVLHSVVVASFDQTYS